MTRPFQGKYLIHKVKFERKKKVWEVICSRNISNAYWLSYEKLHLLPLTEDPSLFSHRTLVLAESFLDSCNVWWNEKPSGEKRLNSNLTRHNCKKPLHPFRAFREYFVHLFFLLWWFLNQCTLMCFSNSRVSGEPCLSGVILNWHN